MVKQPLHKIWNKRFHPKSKRRVVLLEDLWMDRWKQNILDIKKKQALDLGCGCGLDSLYLYKQGFEVTAVDFSKGALEICKENAPDAELIMHDISKPLPFNREQFGIISASLSLHYFDKSTTHQVLADIHRCLDKNGILMVRLNSTKDIHFGAFGESEIEPNYFMSGGMSKRFFDRQSIEYFFNSYWLKVHVEEMITHKYGPPKQLWEVILKKMDG
mgnify:CR=1 FL=1